MRIPALLLATTSFSLLSVHSSHVDAQNFTWNSVITQGMFHTDKNNIYGESQDDISLDYTELSINGSYNFPYSTRLSGQTIYRHAGSGFDGLNLDYLLLDKTLFQDETHMFGIRLGRQKIPYGMLNDARDISFTRPSIYLPQSIYLDLNGRNSILSLDGVGIHTNHFTDNGIFTTETVYGKSDNHDLDNLTLGLDDADFTLDEVVGLRMSYESSFFIGYTIFYTDSLSLQTTIDLNEYVPFSPAPLPTATASSTLKSLGQIISFKYETRNWSILTEYAVTDFKTDTPTTDIDESTLSMLPPNFMDQVPTVDNDKKKSYYIQIDRRLNTHWTLFTKFDFFNIGLNNNSEDNAIGLNWRPRHNTLITMEYHYIDGAGWLNANENQPTRIPELPKYWNLLALSAAYRF